MGCASIKPVIRASHPEARSHSDASLYLNPQQSLHVFAHKSSQTIGESNILIGDDCSIEPRPIPALV